MPTIQQLWKLAEREGIRRGIKPTEVLDPIGLILYADPYTEGYNSTPTNSLTFAETGGDGVHYGILELPDVDPAASPVVMTVPTMFDRPNAIVGSNLQEFLCLGCHTGYFWLEQLVYNTEGTLELLKHPEPVDDEKAQLLDLLQKEFDLKPWVHVEKRFYELQQAYTPLLRFRWG
jgi:hypothetical protein